MESFIAGFMCNSVSYLANLPVKILFVPYGTFHVVHISLVPHGTSLFNHRITLGIYFTEAYLSATTILTAAISICHSR